MIAGVWERFFCKRWSLACLAEQIKTFNCTRAHVNSAVLAMKTLCVVLQLVVCVCVIDTNCFSSRQPAYLEPLTRIHYVTQWPAYGLFYRGPAKLQTAWCACAQEAIGWMNVTVASFLIFLLQSVETTMLGQAEWLVGRTCLTLPAHYVPIPLWCRVLTQSAFLCADIC